MPPRDETLGCTRPNRPFDLPFDQRVATKAQEDANMSTIRRLTNPTSEPNSSDREEGRADGSAPVRRSRGKRRRRWWSGIGRGRERDGTTHSCSASRNLSCSGSVQLSRDLVMVYGLRTLRGPSSSFLIDPRVGGVVVVRCYWRLAFLLV